jgi:hypothetical protein
MFFRSVSIYPQIHTALILKDQKRQLLRFLTLIITCDYYIIRDVYVTYMSYVRTWLPI